MANGQDSTPWGEGSTVVIVQGNEGEPSVVRTLDPRTALWSFVGLKPPRRRRARARHETGSVAWDSRNETPKSGKEVVLAEVRGIRISLSTDSQGRDLSLIPPESDGFSMQEIVNKVNTLPQQSNAEEAWNQAGPEFQKNQTRFRTYGNTFDVGVVLPSSIGPGLFCAHKHTTTNINKPPDIGVLNDDNAIPLRTVAHATVDLSDIVELRSEIGSELTVAGENEFPSNKGFGTRKTHLFTISLQLLLLF